MKKNSDGIQYKRGDDKRVTYYWKIGRDKSKDFSDKRACIEDYVVKYIERYPKYKELIYDKTWDEIFSIFGMYP